MPSRTIHVAEALEESVPRMTYLDRDLEKGVVATALKQAGPLPIKSFPRYRDRVTWLAVLSKGLPDTVSVSGLKYLFNGHENKSRRMVWLVVLLAAMGVMGYQIFDRCRYFAGHPKSVDVEINYVTELTFPTVALCNYNNFRRTELEDHVDFLSLLMETYNANYGFNRVNYTKYLTTLGNVNSSELYYNLSHKIEDSFVYGFWGTELLTPQNFSFDIFDFGVCFTFNTGTNGVEPLKIDTSGKTYGLGLILDAQQWDYYYSSDFHRVSSGFQVMVYDRNEVPLVSELGFAVGPGTENLVGLEIREVNNLPPPHGVCGSKPLKYYSHYTSSGCREECQTDFVVRECGCREPHMPGHAKVCNPVDLYTCAATARANFISTESHNCECPVPCYSLTYEPVLSQAHFPSSFWASSLSELYRQSLNITVDSTYFGNNMVFINLFFKELSIEKITQQEAYPFFSLLCDIGGAMGLWLGGSILTVFEVFDLFSHSTYFYYTRLARRRPKTLFSK
ncbi:acid-sensing ion channel 1C-like [Diadema antillarum]|uniref:acid-sensing ion channel 1C-like n=1 Tax=Diadema antillarum TaxID=105358 RepID=UPI003A8A0907